jgi:hypothetical protein
MRIENIVYCVVSINDYVYIILLIYLFPVHPGTFFLWLELTLLGHARTQLFIWAMKLHEI